MTNLKEHIELYNNNHDAMHTEICNVLAAAIEANIGACNSKIWHGHPVWFDNGNPLLGYSKQKKGIRLMFWSGADFEEENLNVLGGKFKDASIFYNNANEIDRDDLLRWLKKAKEIQWDYKNIVKRKGELVKITF